MKKLLTTSLPLILLLIVTTMLSGCIYSFSEKGGRTLDPRVKTVRIIQFENRAPYINTQLAPNLSDRVRQKIVNQTRLSQTNNDNADWTITGEIRDYAVTTTGVTSANGQSQTSINRLTVTVHIVLQDMVTNEPKEFDVTRQFDFSARQSLQSAEANLLDEMVRNLSDEIFNRLFSDW